MFANVKMLAIVGKCEHVGKYKNVSKCLKLEANAKMWANGKANLGKCCVIFGTEMFRGRNVRSNFGRGGDLDA